MCRSSRLINMSGGLQHTSNIQPILSEDGVNWGVFMESQGEVLRAFIRSRMLGAGESEVEDVFQEVSMVAHSDGARGILEKNAGSWLRGVAANKVRDYWRKVERRGKLEKKVGENVREAANEVREGWSPFDWVMHLERSDYLSEAIGGLDRKSRRVLERKYLEGASCKTIARDEGMKEKAVEYLLKKTRDRLRAVLEKLI